MVLLVDGEPIKQLAGVRKKVAVPTVAGKPVSLWFDATDIDTLWQDLLMTNPITANGQVVEAISDKGPLGYHLDAPLIPPFNKPTYQAVAVGGLSAMAFDRTFNTNNGQVIRSIDFSLVFPIPYMFLAVGNWAIPGVGFNGLFVHSVIDTAQGIFTNGMSVSSGQIDSLQSIGVDGDFAAWSRNEAGGINACSLNVTAGIASGVTGAPTEYITNDPNNIALGGNRNGGAGTSGWHGTISEKILWQGDGNIPTDSAVEAYVTSKYGLGWL